MPYSERQLRCLSAMGLVAWQLRDGAALVGAGRVAEAPVPERAVDGAPVGAMPAVEPSVPESPSVPHAGAERPDAAAHADRTGHTGHASSGESSAAGPVAPEPDAAAPSTSRPPAAPSPTALPAGVGLPPGAEPLTAPALAAPLPREPAALAAWLPDQPLAPFVWKERRLTRIGRDDAPLLVVVERSPSEALPLDGAAAELFERMLGAIGRTRRDTCQCVLSEAPEPDGSTVAALAGAARPITLVLVRELDGALDADGCRLPGEPFGGGAWCLPHPDLLLAEPARKRQAWLVLKAVRQHLPLLP